MSRLLGADRSKLSEVLSGFPGALFEDSARRRYYVPVGQGGILRDGSVTRQLKSTSGKNVVENSGIASDAFDRQSLLALKEKVRVRLHVEQSSPPTRTADLSSTISGYVVLGRGIPMPHFMFGDVPSSSNQRHSYDSSLFTLSDLSLRHPSHCSTFPCSFSPRR